jgi:hypothetical protein
VISTPGEQPGIFTFTASADHASVTSYTINIYALGTSSPTVASVNIGKPTPAADNSISYDITALVAPLTPGNYTAKVQATAPGGSSESMGINFAVPLT